jgi:hypothetical protein
MGAESLAGARAVFDITAAQPRRLFAQNHGGQDKNHGYEAEAMP